MPAHRIEKFVWTDRDFDVMGWHDATIWAMVANPAEYEYMLDLDYIVKWVHPSSNEGFFKFWVSPVTMVFENVSSVVIDFHSQQGIVEVSELHRKHLGLTPNGRMEEYEYRFECQEGRLSLSATGYTMFVRKQPSLIDDQSFTLEERGGVNFQRTHSDA